MRSIALAVAFAALFTFAAPSRAGEPAAPAAADSTAEKCEHGVKKTLCTRCNPKLIPVFKAKGDWCGEHGVPESQCASCNPRLAKEGVK
ncbi:hypothetical protein [Anaeromyxobacter terrae]|uniref:hypothetical protein n=1 Tax=Anaeromyxobacter terrae TaxID=2925406 RepID=UPI001F5A6A05|nr:hypothetical protein [Anaeromyxobacter sp. SG22]